MTYNQTVLPDNVCNGYSLTNTPEQNADCIKFIANYASVLYSNKSVKKWLDNHPDKSFLEMITASDMGIVVTLVKNSQDVWNNPSNAEAKTLFKGAGVSKRQFGGNAMNNEGFSYYNNCCKKWSDTKADVACHRQMLSDWNSFIASSPKHKHLTAKKGRRFEATTAATTGDAPTINLDEEEASTDLAVAPSIELPEYEEEYDREKEEYDREMEEEEEDNEDYDGNDTEDEGDDNNKKKNSKKRGSESLFDDKDSTGDSVSSSSSSSRDMTERRSRETTARGKKKKASRK